MGKILKIVKRKIGAARDYLVCKGRGEEEEAIILSMDNITEAIGRCSTSNLPADTILDILSRLPAKSLVRFKSVCKTWKSLVVSPVFIQMHLLRHQTYNKLLYCPSKNLLSFSYPLRGQDDSMPNHINIMQKRIGVHSYEFLPFRPTKVSEIILVGSSNGLVCIARYYNKYYPDKGHDCYVMNPATGEFQLLPQHQTPVTDYFFNFVFMGFTYLHSLGDYKLVRVCRFGDAMGQRYCIDSFLLSENFWRRTFIQGNCRRALFQSYATITNEYMHWYETPPDMLYTLDMVKETVRRKMMPRYHQLESVGKSLTILKQSLALFIYPNCNFLYRKWIDIWLTNDSATAPWTLLLCVMPQSISSGVPLQFWSKDEHDEILFGDKDNFFLYNIHTKQSCNIPSPSVTNKTFTTTQFHPHTDTLVSVKRNEPDQTCYRAFKYLNMC